MRPSLGLLALATIALANSAVSTEDSGLTLESDLVDLTLEAKLPVPQDERTERPGPRRMRNKPQGRRPRPHFEEDEEEMEGRWGKDLVEEHDDEPFRHHELPEGRPFEDDEPSHPHPRHHRHHGPPPPPPSLLHWLAARLGLRPPHPRHRHHHGPPPPPPPFRPEDVEGHDMDEEFDPSHLPSPPPPRFNHHHFHHGPHPNSFHPNGQPSLSHRFRHFLHATFFLLEAIVFSPVYLVFVGLLKVVVGLAVVFKLFKTVRRQIKVVRSKKEGQLRLEDGEEQDETAEKGELPAYVQAEKPRKHKHGLRKTLGIFLVLCVLFVL